MYKRQLLPDVDYAVINSNYAINAGLNPVNDSLLIEGSASAYANILTVKEGNETDECLLFAKKHCFVISLLIVVAAVTGLWIMFLSLIHIFRPAFFRR